EGVELGPGDLGVDAATEATVGRTDDGLGTNEASEADETVGYELGMLNNVRGVGDNAGEDPAAAQVAVLAHAPLVFVADVAGLERVLGDINVQHRVGDVLELDIGGVRAVPGTPAQVVTHTGSVEALEGLVDGINAGADETHVVLRVDLRGDL